LITNQNANGDGMTIIDNPRGNSLFTRPDRLFIGAE